MSNQGKGKSIWKNYRFPILLIGSIVVGSVIGMVMGEKATVLKPFGDIFLNLMFTAIVPLVFATIASAVGNMMNMKRLDSILGNMFLVFVITGIIAGIVIITAVTICPPAQGVDIAMEAAGDMEAVKLSDAIVNAITVNDFSAILSRKNMLPLIVFSILFLIFSVFSTFFLYFRVFHVVFRLCFLSFIKLFNYIFIFSYELNFYIRFFGFSKPFTKRILGPFFHGFLPIWKDFIP